MHQRANGSCCRREAHRDLHSSYTVRPVDRLSWMNFARTGQTGMDYATIVGIVVGLIVVGMAIVLGGSVNTFINIPSLLIVVGGGMAATLIRFPLKSVMGAFKTGAGLAFSEKQVNLTKTHEELVNAARIAKLQGPIALENVQSDNPFVAKSLQMICDQMKPEYIRGVLEAERDLLIERLADGEKVFRALGDAAPAFGMIGTLVGLVQMLSTMSDPETIGPAMAVALLTTLYGALLANLIALPVADKLASKLDYESLSRTMVIEAAVRMAERENVDLMADYLSVFIPEKDRAAVLEAAAAAA